MSLWDVEGSYAHVIDSGSMEFLHRAREWNGIVWQRLDLHDGHTDAARTIVILGNMAYFEIGYTLWLTNGDIIIFCKDGQFGDDWKMLRIRP